MTRRQGNNQWSGGIAAYPAPKNSECKNPLEKFSPRFLWDQDGIFLVDYLPKDQTTNEEYYLSLLVQLKGILKEKRRRKFTKGVLFLHDNVPAHRALTTQKNWPTWSSSVLITHPILRIWPRRNTTCSVDWKRQLKGHHFSSEAEVIAAAETWLDGQLSEYFLSGLQKLEQRAKKFIELCGKYVE